MKQWRREINKYTHTQARARTHAAIRAVYPVKCERARELAILRPGKQFVRGYFGATVFFLFIHPLFFSIPFDARNGSPRDGLARRARAHVLAMIKGENGNNSKAARENCALSIIVINPAAIIFT